MNADQRRSCGAIPRRHRVPVRDGAHCRRSRAPAPGPPRGSRAAAGRSHRAAARWHGGRALHDLLLVPLPRAGRLRPRIPQGDSLDDVGGHGSSRPGSDDAGRQAGPRRWSHDAESGSPTRSTTSSSGRSAGGGSARSRVFDGQHQQLVRRYWKRAAALVARLAPSSCPESENSLTKASHGFKDLVGRLGPDEGLGVFVVDGQVAADGVFDLSPAAMYAARRSRRLERPGRRPRGTDPRF